jgi:hypothetical protein
VTTPPESIEVGRCYLTTSGQVRRVLGFLPQRVRFERRVRTTGSDWGWVPGLAERRAFTLVIEREVPCNWTPEMDEVGP